MTFRFEALSLALRGRAVLSDVSGELTTGRITVILGANGAGKSSLLACLAGQFAPDSGRIMLGDIPLMALDRRERARRIGLLPQRADIHWDVDVKTLVGLGRLPHRGRWGESDDDRAAVDRALAATDCRQLADRSVNRLSGGEQGRVLLARVLAGEPQWLLADEPLASLDPAHQLDVLDILRQSAGRGTGIALVLHDLVQASRIADDVLVLKAGKVIAFGPRDEVLVKDVLSDAYGVEIDIVDVAGERLCVPVHRR